DQGRDAPGKSEAAGQHAADHRVVEPPALLLLAEPVRRRTVKAAAEASVRAQEDELPDVVEERRDTKPVGMLRVPVRDQPLGRPHGSHRVEPQLPCDLAPPPAAPPPP